MAGSFQNRKDLYLSRYGRICELDDINLSCKIDTIVVIPSLAEAQHLPDLLQSLKVQNTADLAATLFLFVVNNSEAADDEIRRNNLNSIRILRDETFNTKGTDSGKLQIAVIDCASKGRGLPAKEAGVGLARKAGLDTALTLFSEHLSGNLLICLDADCTVAPDYISVIREKMKKGSYNAAVVEYEHSLPDDDELNLKAIICYELFLRHYSLGLKYINSPYAFHSVGSTMVFTADTYIKAQGMNKLKAGEDFYFLQKIAKFTSVEAINETRVFPSARESLRVPFGTGQRVNRFFRNGISEYLVHNPESFKIIKTWYSGFKSHPELSGANLLEESFSISDLLGEFLKNQGFQQDWERLRAQSGNLAKQVDAWFDGFRIMKCLHYLRDNGLADLPTFEGIDDLFDMMDIRNPISRVEMMPPVKQQIEYLKFIRKVISG